MQEKTVTEVNRLTNLLASAIRFSSMKQRDVEKALDMSSGIMSRVLHGEIDLKFRHVLTICEVLGLPPSHFFHVAYPEAVGGDRDSVRLQGLLERLHPVPESVPKAVPTPPPPPALQEAEIERLVFRMLAKFFSTAAGNPPPG
jgi:transcriptional regulator with XRE-family HTH domain